MIDVYAFFQVSTFNTVYFYGTQEQYNNGGFRFNSNSITVYFYSENEPVSVGNYWHYVMGVPTIWPAA